MSKWIDFVEYPTNGVTKAFTVVPKENEAIYIGKIKWYAPWRKFAFFPEPNCVFETQCLKDITSFIDKLMLDRKIKKQTLN
jgi:hypothetical protein